MTACKGKAEKKKVGPPSEDDGVHQGKCAGAIKGKQKSKGTVPPEEDSIDYSRWKNYQTPKWYSANFEATDILQFSCYVDVSCQQMKPNPSSTRICA